MESKSISAARSLAESVRAQYGADAVAHLLRAITAAVRACDDAEVGRLDAALQLLELVEEPDRLTAIG